MLNFGRKNYRKLINKKSLLLIFFLILSLPLIKHFSHIGVPVTHDGQNHLARFSNFYVAIKEKQFPPRFAPNLLNHYGYPVFNYNYPLANIISLPFSILGFHFELSYKIICSLFILTGITFAYLYLTELKFSLKAKLYSTAVFALTPFLLSTIIFRGNIGEIMSWGLLPVVLYYLQKLKNSKKYLDNNFLLTTFVFAIFLISHNITAYFGMIVIFIYLLFIFKNNIFLWKKLFLILTLASSTVLWFWIPAIFEKKYVLLDIVDLSSNFGAHFPSLRQLLSPLISFGYSYPSAVDDLTFSLGTSQLITMMLFFVLIIKQKNFKYLINFLLAFILIIGQLKFSSFIFDILPMAKFIQFPWRLAILLPIMLLPLSAFIFEKFSKQIKLLLILIVIAQYLYFLSIKPIDFIHKSTEDFIFFPGSTTINKENLPRTFLYEEYTPWQPTPEIIEGNGSINLTEWRGTSREYSLNLSEDSIIIEPTVNFIGWESYYSLDNTNWTKIDYIDDNTIKGRIGYKLSKGNYTIKSRFTQKTWSRILGNYTSLLGILIYLGLFIKSYRFKSKS